MSDPFQPAERRYRATLKVLKLLNAHSYPTVISTKGTLPAEAPYLQLLREMKAVVQFSFASTRARVAAAIEPKAPSPASLLRTMETLANAGVKVVCRWQPYIPKLSEGADEFVRRVTSAGARHIGFEHLKVPLERGRHWPKLALAAGKDPKTEYLQLGARRDGREYVLPPKMKIEAVLAVAAATRKEGATFGSADNEFQYLSDTGCCCSGVDQFPGFEHWFTHQIGHAIRRSWADQTPLIQYESIADEWKPTGSVDRFLNSRSRLAMHGSIGTIDEHLRRRWNDLNVQDGPASFYGVLPTNDFSASGFRVYAWDAAAVSGIRNGIA